MELKFTRADALPDGAPDSAPQQEIHYTLEGISLGLRVTANGIDVLGGGAPAFDTPKEERAWNRQIDLCIIAQRFLKQGARVPDDSALAALARSVTEPE